MTAKLFGMLNIDKPAGWSSRDAVNRVARLVKPAKAGHAGTLDPMATGVLVVCVGSATRLVSRVQQSRKTYLAEFELGKTSNTDDATGEIEVTAGEGAVSEEEVRRLLPEFRGEILQVPPQFSAVHVNGKRAYKLARQGQEVQLEPRPVEVYRLELTEFAYPRFSLEIECGSGTYIRSIGRDLGKRLGCGALMTKLVRTRIGKFDLSTAISPQELTREQLEAALLSPRLALPELPAYSVTTEEAAAILTGRAIAFPPRLQDLSAAEEVVLCDHRERVIALAETNSGNQLVPRMVFPR